MPEPTLDSMDFNGRDYITGLDAMVPTTGGMRPYTNLDNAATTPPLRSVMQKINEFAPWYSSVHRGNGFKSRLSTDIYEQAHDIVESLLAVMTANI